MVEKELDIEDVRRAASAYFQEPFTLGDVPKHWSTHVYAVYSGGKTYYLRISNEDTSLAVEVKTHEMLLDIGVTVPRVLYFEHKNEAVGLSMMIEEEIPGSSVELNPPEENLELILHDAGRQIALANQIPVDGFDELDRNYYYILRGKARTFADLWFTPLEQNIKALEHYPFTTSEIDLIDRLLHEGYERMKDYRPCLSHGDFDPSHIFHHRGRYSGLIDWGDVGGMPAMYDLATFRILDETPNGIGYQAVISGYNEIHSLTPDDLYNVELLSLLHGIGWLKNVERPMAHQHFFPIVQNHLGYMKSTIK